MSARSARCRQREIYEAIGKLLAVRERETEYRQHYCVLAEPATRQLAPLNWLQPDFIQQLGACLREGYLLIGLIHYSLPTNGRAPVIKYDFTELTKEPGAANLLHVTALEMCRAATDGSELREVDTASWRDGPRVIQGGEVRPCSSKGNA